MTLRTRIVSVDFNLIVLVFASAVILTVGRTEAETVNIMLIGRHYADEKTISLRYIR